ncbi:hypothetical protein [Morganella psychrotolerans]|uniref:Uncharacterized protein n=1 Tax=Morganella psychrotolerans TaxID=368603 RepID=A0A1B8HMW5_9GAMM|nr:hypothetical protein [Morganella psychrotolerans]OBU10779.1 hypothetical protein AYY17_14770 [Morganella psychrotolerans]
MEKKNHPSQVASENSVASSILSKNPPKKHRARLYMLGTGINGFTENEILFHCRLSSGRNYPNELERKLNIELERIDEPNPDGIGSHYRYRFKTTQDVQKVINLINRCAEQGKYQPVSKALTDNILSLYPAE